jgi:N-acetylmuramoyl-L-alanine amidase
VKISLTIGLLISSTGAILGQNTQLAKLTEIRYWSNRDYTRAVIQLDSEVRFTQKILRQPDRLFLDLEGTSVPNTLDRSYNVNGVFLKKIRAAENRPGVVRVVLDFNEIRSHSTFTLYDPFRIVIDTKGTSPPPNPETASRTVTTTEATISLEKSPSRRQVVTERDIPGKPANAELSLTRTLGLKVQTIVIDPGHGGRDIGTKGNRGLTEKELVLDVALRLQKLLQKHLKIEVILTRRADIFVPLEERTAIANKMGADLFLSIHANASSRPDVSGVETFHLSFASGAEELEVASRENARAQRSVRELEEILRKMVQEDYNEESHNLAMVVQESLYELTHAARPKTRNRGVKRAPFIVLVNTNMPSILTEIGFLSNPSDERYFEGKKSRKQIAAALFKGVSRYVDILENNIHSSDEK